MGSEKVIMTGKAAEYGTHTVEAMILTVRGQKVILDSDLAALYGVETKMLNRALKRNSKRFPPDFVFRLTAEENRALRCQIGTSKGRGGRRNLPSAFTEHGAIMAASVLNSRQAVEMSVFVVRAFVRMRSLLGDTRELARQLAALEKELKERLDVHEVAIVSILQRVMDLIDPPVNPKPTPRKRIGFEVKERAARYVRRRSKS